MFLFPAAISAVSFQDSPVECQSNNTACDNHGDNLIESLPGIETLWECRELCSDNPNYGCEFLTYFGDSAFPFKNFCQLFRSCETTVDCTGCVTEVRGCFGSCSNNVIGAIEDNFVDYITNLPSESACINECRKRSSCNFYTFYLEDDPNSGACVLLSSIIEPLAECPTCVTGPVECDNFDDCGFFYNGKQENHMMFTQPGTEIELSTKGVSISTCELRILAVGGGGNGYGYKDGGGSGYIQYVTQTLSSSPTFIKFIVGDEQKESNVTIAGNTIRALPGTHIKSDGNGGYRGGDGFSGGGPDEPCNGGTNGGDGECINGGKGTGEDISKYHFSNYELSAGAGGVHYTSSSGTYYNGGGGGGIMINGDGPGVRVNKAKEEASAGEGYGGGGTGGRSTAGYGHPGVILIEIVSI